MGGETAEGGETVEGSHAIEHAGDCRWNASGSQECREKTAPRDESPQGLPQVSVDAWVAKATGGGGHQECEPFIVVDSVELVVFGVLLQQVSLKQGIHMWGNEAKASVIKEIRQIHDRSAFIPRDPKSLT